MFPPKTVFSTKTIFLPKSCFFSPKNHPNRCSACVHLLWYEILISGLCLSVCRPPGRAATKDQLCQDAAGEQSAAQGDRAAQEGAPAVQEVQGEATDQQEILPGHVVLLHSNPSREQLHNFINHLSICFFLI